MGLNLNVVLFAAFLHLPKIYAGCPGLNQFECGNGRCIPDKYLCDNRQDCEDGSDEPGRDNYCPCIYESPLCNIRRKKTAVGTKESLNTSTLVLIAAIFLGLVLLSVAIYLYKANKRYRLRKMYEDEEDDLYVTHRGMPAEYYKNNTAPAVAAAPPKPVNIQIGLGGNSLSEYTSFSGRKANPGLGIVDRVLDYAI